MNDQVIDYSAEYLGGHCMYVGKKRVSLSIHPEEVCISVLNIQIPYFAIKEVKNIDESHMNALRVIAFGVVGALWKKKETYLCLVYNDGVQEQSPVFKIDRLEEAQREIYQRVTKSKFPRQELLNLHSVGEELR